MADWENRLGQESPLSRALRVAMPEDLRNPLLHPEAVNHFALPPQQPRAELRNPAPRPGDYLSPVSEALSPTMGAYGLGNALGDAYVQGREGNYKGMASPLAEILLSMAPVPGMKRGAMPPRVENPIKAYHGSPHDFDRFDLSKIGTGEGAQAFGHGLYMAENESVARSYRRFGDHEVDQLTRALQDARDQFKPQDLTAENLRRVAVERFPKLAGLPPQTWQDAAIAANGKLRNGPGISTEAKDAYDRIYARHPKPEGHMYEVAIHASPDQFLDWDKPLSQQSEAVRTALSEIDGIALRGNDIRVNRNGDYAVYERPLEALVAQRGSPEAASAALRDAGVVGIQYLDQGSRGAGAGTMNRVVFDPNLIEILRKYGLLGPVAAGATANALMGDKDQQ